VLLAAAIRRILWGMAVRHPLLAGMLSTLGGLLKIAAYWAVFVAALIVIRWALGY